MESTHHERPSGVACSFQVAEDPIRAATAESRDILSDDPTWLDFADNSRILRPQPGPSPFDARALAGARDILAGEAAADEVDGSDAVLLEPLRREGPDVVVEPGFRPVLAEDSPGIPILFAEGDGVHADRFEAKGKPSDAAEDVEDSHEKVSP
jgi:hypothetical protein